MVELSPSLLPELDSDAPWIRRKLGWMIALLVVVAAAVGGYWYFIRDTSTPAAAPQQQTTTVTNGRLVTTFSGTGTASSTLTSKLTFQTSAKVTAVNAKLGDTITAGQVLATLDSGDAQRKLDSAKVSLASAQLKLSDLLKPATSSAVVSAQASVSAAQYQLANAQQNLVTAQGGPDATAVATADAAVAQAEQSLTSAQNQVQSAWISLLTAQRNYCTTDNRLVSVCQSTDLPLTQTKVDALIAEIRNPATTAVGTAAQSLISSNTSYGNTQTSVTNATTALATAKTKRSDLDTPPTALAIQQLQTAIDNANASVLTAQQKLDDLLKGPTATDVAQQQGAVQSAQITVDTAQVTLDSVTLVAPFAGTITAVGIAVGDTVSPSTAAFTITNTDAIRVDLAVQEADFVGLKAGQYGIATFTALTGYEYVVRITFVNPTPTTTQGVVSYQVQAEILRASQLQDPATQQAVVQALAAVGTGVRAGGRTGGAPGTGAAAGITPGANGAAGRTPGAGANGAA
ncbi:MAG: HlyD family efflux transporter periplasmic adaptor subunit, partial [bacterium]